MNPHVTAYDQPMLPSRLLNDRWKLAALGVCAAIGLGVLVWWMPLAGLAVGLTIPLVVVMLAWPNLATLAMIFLIYVNAPVVAVKFHGVPYAVGASVPLLLAIPLAYLLLVRGEKVILDRVIPWILTFAMIQFVSLVFCADPWLAMADLMTTLVEGLALYLLVINVVRTPAMLRQATWALLLAGSLLGSLSALQYVTKTYRNDYGGFAQAVSINPNASDVDDKTAAHGRRLSGPIGEVNRYAQIMLMLVPLAFFRFWGERRPVLRLLALGAMLLTMAGLTLTFSRGAAVGFLLMLGLVVMLGYVTRTQCALILAAGCLPLLVVPQFSERLSSLGDLWSALNREGQGIQETDTSIQGRFTENMAAAMMYAEHPLLGVGPGMYPLYYRAYAERIGGRIHKTERMPHILYLGLGAELGTLGLGVFLVIAFRVLRDLARARRRVWATTPDLAHMATAFMLALLAYLATGLFLHFSYERYFWLMVAMAGATARIAAASHASPPEQPEVANP